MGVLDAEISEFMDALDGVIDEAMRVKVSEAAKGYIQMAVVTEVYMKYEPTDYVRKLDHGGLADMREPPVGSMKSCYDSKTKTLTVENVRNDWEPTRDWHRGRSVPIIVEENIRDYDWWKRRFKRPFHDVAEQNLIKGGDVDFHIEDTYNERMGGRNF